MPERTFKIPLSSPVICVVGPTASGKSSLAQEIAKTVDAEVVSADSMQVYAGMDIGTGKVPISEQVVKHWGLDLVNPGEPYSAALFQAYARACFEDIEGRGKRVVLCGGTGFYVRAAVDDYDFPAGEQVGNAIRDTYNTIAETQGPQELWDMLHEADPESAEIIPCNDVKRVVRAFELLDEGTTYARQREKLASIPQAVPAQFIGLHVQPDALRARIDKRVDAMVSAGLVEEVQHLLELGFREGITAPQAIGYKEVVAYLDGSCTLEEAVEAIKTATHRYAKRQRTWFRKDARITWLDATVYDVERLLSQAMDFIR